jgi:superfamily II DNA or RNA helicase
LKGLVLPSRIDTLIADCASWSDFRDLASQQKNTKDKGDLFERLTQIYLQTHPTYRSKIKNVWWCNNGELPEQVRKKLNLPKTDEGIDLLCETYEDEYWSVQSKYQANSDQPLNYKKLSTFLSLSFVTAKGISTGLIVHTSTKKVKKSHLMGNTVELGLQHWLEISDGQWDQILDVCRGNLLQPPKKRNPRKYQELAIEKAKEHFLKEGCNRGKLIMPCGTGKSLIAYWATQALSVRSVIVAVPSLALVKQSLKDWTSEYLAEGIHPEWMAVCSDDSVGKMKEADSTVATVYEAGIPTTTDPAKIVDFIQKKSKNPKVIFTTYQSSPKLADACKQEGLTIDLLIADEAHKTVGRKDKKFATLLSDENVKIKQRMFMTATERVYRQGSENIASMDDESVYGKRFHKMSFKQAIDDGIICDYKILTVAVSGSEVANLIAEHADVTTQLGNQKLETDAHNLAAGIAIEKVFEKHKIKHALSFHRSIKRAEDFNKQQDAFSGKLGSKLLIENLNISSRLSAGQRSQLLNDFAAGERSLISNARCLTEGVDIPSIDCVAFVDPKQSTVDIVQAAGRAMRQSKETGKTHGYIVLPIMVPDGLSLSDFAETTDFATVARVITSLSTQDERIVEQLRSRDPGQPPDPKDIVTIDPDISEFLNVDYGVFQDSIKTVIWEKVAKANWLPFEEARDFVRQLNIKNVKEWNDYAVSDLRPPDIPYGPNLVYSNVGWSGYGDWLGTGRLSNSEKDFLNFREARKFAWSLGLNSQREWEDFASSSDRPFNIPSNPNYQYKDTGWTNLGDWLGTGSIAPQNKVYRSFEEARNYACSLKIKGQSAWELHTKSDDFPDDIPVAVNRIYKDHGWKGFPHFLGYEWREFFKAREFVHSLRLTSTKEWEIYVESSLRPIDIPATPRKVYKNMGWNGFVDWLGIDKAEQKKNKYLPFIEARAFVHSLSLAKKANYKNDPLETQSWQNYSAGRLSDTIGTRPENIPSDPRSVYKETGWNGWADWLGT